MDEVLRVTRQLEDARLRLIFWADVWDDEDLWSVCDNLSDEIRRLRILSITQKAEAMPEQSLPTRKGSGDTLS